MHPEVILSSNVTHYYYAAKALTTTGQLKKYICAIAFTRSLFTTTKYLPSCFKKIITLRTINGIGPELVRSIWLPEILQRGLPAMGIITEKQGNWVNDHLFDRIALRYITPCDIFHYLPGTGYACARKAKHYGAVALCDERQEHPDFQQNILADEYTRLRLSSPPSPSLSIQRIKAAYEEADYIILPSIYAKNTFIQAGFPPEKLIVLPYGVDLQHFKSESRSINSHKEESPIFRIIYTGSIIPRKGVHYLIQAFQELKLPQSELMLIGEVSNTMRPFIQAALSRATNIRILGHLPKMELANYYNESSVFVLPSLADSFGLVCLEAMACGLPVVVTENTGSKEAVQEGVNGFVIPIRNVEILKEKLSWMYTHQDRRIAMGKAAAENSRYYTWDIYGQNLLDIYSQVMDQKHPLY